MANVQEKFLPIKGFEGYYEISNFGKVKSLRRRITRSDGRIQTLKERILKPGTGTNGYHYFICSYGGKFTTIYLHREVAKNFIENPHNKPCVNHKDCNKKNNVASNLEWVTMEENSKHAVKNGRISACWTGKKLSTDHKESIGAGLKKHYENHLHWTKQRKQGYRISYPL